MVLKGLTSKLLSVSFSRWPEYLSDEQHSLEMPSKKEWQGSFLVTFENERRENRRWWERKEEGILKKIFLTKK